MKKITYYTILPSKHVIDMSACQLFSYIQRCGSVEISIRPSSLVKNKIRIRSSKMLRIIPIKKRRFGCDLKKSLSRWKKKIIDCFLFLISFFNTTKFQVYISYPYKIVVFLFVIRKNHYEKQVVYIENILKKNILYKIKKQ